jgi:pectinesterase
MLAAWCATGLVAPCFADIHLTVRPSGAGGAFATVQAAVDAVPVGNTQRHIIDIYPGTYAARVKIPGDKPFITLRGLGPQPGDTVLTFNETSDASPNESTAHASTVVQGHDFVAENLTFANSYGPGKQALALYAKADRLVFNNVRFTGYQDTLRSEFGRHYFYKTYVEGAVDFVYGKGTAYFDQSTLFAKASGYVTAQGREAAAESNGYVFKDSTVTGSAPNGSVYLGRPWQAFSRAVFIDTKIGPVVSSAGWSAWSGNNNHLTAFFAEYQSKDLAGNPLNVSGRVSWSHQLTSAEAGEYSKSEWLGGADGWDPQIAEPAGPGDFDRDGTVGASDLYYWRLGFGAAAGAASLLGDADADGDVDGGDFLKWQAAFGKQSLAMPTTSIVPEPASGWAGFALSAWALRRLATRTAP